MASRSRLNVWLLTLLCGALLVARASGAHLHLCFDGAEPFASVHVLDVDAPSPGPGLAATHHDDEISLTGDLVGKSGKIALDTPAVSFPAPFARAADELPRAAKPESRGEVFASNGRLLLPPPRAPPAC